MLLSFKYHFLTIQFNKLPNLIIQNLCTKKRKQKKHAQISDDLDHNKSLKYNAVKILLTEAKVEKDEIIVNSLKPDEVEKNQIRWCLFMASLRHSNERKLNLNQFEAILRNMDQLKCKDSTYGNKMSLKPLFP